KPELKSDPFLLPSFEPQSTCIPGEKERDGTQAETVDGFISLLAHRYHARPRPPPAPALLDAARTHAAGPDEGVRLIAVSLLVEPFLTAEQRDRNRGTAAEALGRLAQAHPGDAFFQLAGVAGPDAETSPVGVPALERLERLAQGGTLGFPGRLLRDTLQGHLRPQDFRDYALSTAVEVVLDIALQRYLERVLHEHRKPERPCAA